MEIGRWVGCTLLVAVIGCTDARSASSTTTAGRAEASVSTAVVTSNPPDLTTSPDTPPEVVVVSGSRSIFLAAWTWDTKTAAYDGTAPASPPDLGPVVDAVTIHVDDSSWILDAAIEGSGCTIDKPAQPSFALTQVLRWSGPAGNYVVTLHGANADGRSLNVTFKTELPSPAGCG
jgi:hypothetical protein